MDEVVGEVTNKAVNVQVFAWWGGPPTGGFDEVVDSGVGGAWIGESGSVGITRR